MSMEIIVGWSKRHRLLRASLGAIWRQPLLVGRPIDGLRDQGEWAPSLGDKPQAGATRRWHVVAYDFGVKLNILRRLVDVGCDVTVVPASATAMQIEALKPDGVFLVERSGGSGRSALRD